jgi:malate dehydrogenase (oxaloacetate-decarboxylating)(NADP+)
VGRVYPSFARIREVSAVVAAAVAEVAYARGLTDRERPGDPLADIRMQMYEPDYPTYV